MEISGLFESEADDYVGRASAAMVHKQIAWWLQNNEDRIERRCTLAGDDGGFLLFSQQIDLDEDYPDLVIAFLPASGEVAGGFGSKAAFGIPKDNAHPMLRGKKVIFVRCLKAPRDFSHVADRFRVGWKSAFFHEFQHYLLSARRSPGARSSAEAMAQGGIAAYFNDNDETNAYYLEATHDAVDFFNTVREHAPEKLQQFADMTTPELITWAKAQFFFEPFLRHASPKTARALDKRLYRFFEDGMRPMFQRVLRNYQ